LIRKKIYPKINPTKEKRGNPPEVG
jgi:hypothetical protein